MKRKTKKEMVLEIYDREAMGEVTAREIALINQGLIDEFGEGGEMTPAEIARVLVEEDLPVRFEQIFRMSTRTDKYDSILEGLSENRSLAEAAASLQTLDEIYRKFKGLGDQTGMRLTRQTALRAKTNAQALAQSALASHAERLEQEEIVQWFTIWLQTPDLFAPWLELRTAAPPFKAAFPDYRR
ncbi:MAG TPA: hypothetical protein VJ302_00195 [Blastocatellia bacterium]|nr:hypothetical protein [Blastocatellia bacterium]